MSFGAENRSFLVGGWGHDLGSVLTLGQNVSRYRATPDTRCSTPPADWQCGLCQRPTISV